MGLKSRAKELLEEIYLSDYLDWYFKLLSSFRAKKEMLQRMVFWSWKMRNSYDFDTCTLYEMIYLKLERVHNVMKNHGHLLWNSDTESPLMRRLCEAKLLARALDKDDYSRNYTAFNKKYKSNRETGNFLDDFRDKLYPNSKVIDHELYRVMFKAAIKRDADKKKEDKDRLFKLLNVYIEHWWD